MTTKTKAADPATAAAQREQELAQQLADAQADEARVRDQMGEHRGRVHPLKSALAELTITSPGQFTVSGVVLPDTEAEALAEEAEQLEQADQFDAVLNGAIVRRTHAEDELRQHHEAAALDLLRAMVPQARAAVAAWDAWTAEGEKVYRELVGISNRSAQLVVSSRIYRGNSRLVPDFNHQGYVLREARSSAPLPLPTPFVEGLLAEGADDV